MDDGEVIGCIPIQLEASHRRKIEMLVHELPEIVRAGGSAIDTNMERFEKLIKLYGEEPQLLDPILRDLVGRLLGFVHWPASSDEPLDALSTAALERLGALTHVRGYKVLIRLLPHGVDYLSLLLNCLEYYAKNDKGDKNNEAQIIFALTAWLLIICKNPFNLAKFDTSLAKSSGNDDGARKTAQRIIDCMSTFKEQYIQQGGMSIVTTLLAQILTRNDNNMEVLRPRVTAAVEALKRFGSEMDGGRVLIANLRLLGALFKWGKREEMKRCTMDLIVPVIDRLLGVNCVNTEVRNQAVKLLQRIAMVALRPRLAAWRYKCGHRSLEDSLKGRQESSSKPPLPTDMSNNKDENEDETGNENFMEADVPFELLEKIVQELLEKINDRDNVVRWTAAKGIARICARLNREMAAEVVASVMSTSFADTTSGGNWHGGCLALAELSRRGCLLPDQVPLTVSILAKALLFEQSLSGMSVCVNVRDAACYICWAFSRAYEAQVLRLCLGPIAYNLVSVALFDREVNIRRAASAAFQENVGRNDCFPHGIAVLNIIDYSDVALIRHCYLSLSLRVAAFVEYCRPLLDHLIWQKCQHWDENIRELAAEALHLLTPLDADYARNVLFDKVCTLLSSSEQDAAVKHGMVFAAAGLLTGLHAANALAFEALPQRDFLLSFVSVNRFLLENHRVKGFALLAKALCRFVQAMCAVKAPLSHEQLSEYHDVLDLVISDTKERLHAYAAAGFDDLMAYYNSEHLHLLLERIRRKYFVHVEGRCMEEVERSSAIVSLSYVRNEFLALSVEEDGVTKSLAETILPRLINVINDQSTPSWVFARVAAIKTATNLLTRHVPDGYDFSTIIDSFITASDDYTSTVSGDIGRFARREAVLGLVQLLPIAYTTRKEIGAVEEDRISMAVGKIVQRCCEPIDSLRSASCEAMARLLNEFPLIDRDRDVLERVFVLKKNDDGSGDFESIDWVHARGFLRLEPLLDSEAYRRNALFGFVLSSGSVAQWTSMSAYEAIARHLKPIKKDIVKFNSFLMDFAHVYELIAERKHDVSSALLLFQMLLNDRMFAAFESEPDESAPLVGMVEKAIRVATGRGKPKVKVLAIGILGAVLVQFDERSRLYSKCVKLLVSMLQSPYGIIRETSVKRLYEAITAFNDAAAVCGEGEPEDQRVTVVTKLLMETPWSDPERKADFAVAAPQILHYFLRNSC